MATLTDSTNDQFAAIAAIRYCLSRQSYATGIGQEWARQVWPDLTRQTRNTIARDLAEALMDGLAGDPGIDAPGWRDLLAWCWERLDDAGREWVRDATRWKERQGKRWPLDPEPEGA